MPFTHVCDLCVVVLHCRSLVFVDDPETPCVREKGQCVK